MTTTARTTPTGPYLENGYQILIASAADPDVQFWEKSVQPPGVSGGAVIPISTQHNVAWNTSAPRSLKTLTPIQITAAYNPVVYDQIVDLINVNGWWTVHFPDGSTLDFPATLTDFIPGAMSEGNPPEANLTLVPTNQLLGVEEGPDYTAPNVV